MTYQISSTESYNKEIKSTLCNPNNISTAGLKEHLRQYLKHIRPRSHVEKNQQSNQRKVGKRNKPQTQGRGILLEEYYTILKLKATNYTKINSTGDYVAM